MYHFLQFKKSPVKFEASGQPHLWSRVSIAHFIQLYLEVSTANLIFLSSFLCRLSRTDGVRKEPENVAETTFTEETGQVNPAHDTDPPY